MERPLSTVTGRRNLIFGAARLAAGLGAAALIGCSGETPEQKTPTPTAKVEGLHKSGWTQKVERAEKSLEEQPLTPEGARSLITPIANLISETMVSKYSPEEIAANTFIVRGDFNFTDRINSNTPIETLMNLEGLRNLRLDYPDLEFPDEDEIRSIVTHFRSNGIFGGGALGFNSGISNRVYISLDQVNNTPAQISQYTNVATMVDCKPANPAVIFRHAMIHENVHREANEKTPIDAETLAAFESVTKNTQGIDKLQGFFATLKTGNHLQDSTQAKYNFLDEFVTDYIATKINEANNLPFVGFYYDPHEYANFEIMLKAANISVAELSNMHAHAQLKMFMTRMGQAADKNSKQPTENPLLVGARVAYVIIQSNVIMWENLKKYFPAVDSADYGYPKNRFSPNAKLGCR